MVENSHVFELKASGFEGKEEVGSAIASSKWQMKKASFAAKMTPRH